LSEINTPEMKRLIIILITMFYFSTTGAQNKQEVIASSGGFKVNGGISISWTLGETIIPASKNGNLVLIPGFQEMMMITKVEENIDVQVHIKVFPNPAGEILNIQFDALVEDEIDLTIVDFEGVLVKKDIIETAITEKQVDLKNLPPGIYFLRLTKGRLVNVYKVVKL
jgi:hypothetical protein